MYNVHSSSLTSTYFMASKDDDGWKDQGSCLAEENRLLCVQKYGEKR